MPVAPEGTVIKMPDGSRRQKVGGAWVAVDAGQAPVRAAPRLPAQEQMQLSSAREAATGSREAAITAQRFVDENQVAPTGGLLRQIPLAPQIESLWNPQVGMMNALSAKMAPQQRQPGSGTTSDRDLSLYLQATPSPKKPGPVNAEIASQAAQDASRRSQYAQFLDRWAQDHGTLIGAEAAWQAAGGGRAGGPASQAIKPRVAPEAAMRRQQALKAAGKLDLSAKRGSQANPYIAKDQATADRLPKGSYVILPDGSLGIAE